MDEHATENAIEEQIERQFWHFDKARKSGRVSERDAFKSACRVVYRYALDAEKRNEFGFPPAEVPHD